MGIRQPVAEAVGNQARIAPWLTSLGIAASLAKLQRLFGPRLSNPFQTKLAK